MESLYNSICMGYGLERDTAGLLHAVAAVCCSLSELKLKKHGIHCKCTHIHINTMNNKIMKVVDYGLAKNYKSLTIIGICGST